MLLKKKIIASSISNLTDARYFAGWMVDYIVFNVDPDHEFYTNPQEIGAFQSWVEGPQYVLEMKTEQYAYCEKYLVDFNCQSILISFADRALVSAYDIPVIYRISPSEYESNYSLIKEMDAQFVIQIKDLQHAMEMLNSFPCDHVYFDVSDVKIEEKDLLADGLAGFMVHGSPEEKVGFKSFDELDEIFEVLQDF